MDECAFDLSLINNFEKVMTAEDMANFLREKHVTNIYETSTDHECFANFNAELVKDYWACRANPESYVKDGINARVVWELRKSAILWDFMDGEKDPWFFEAHKAAWGVKEIKEYRADIMRTKFVDYIDRDWQYFWVTRFGLKDWKDIRIDAELLFADGDPDKPDELGDPIRDLAWRLVPVDSYKPKIEV